MKHQRTEAHLLVKENLETFAHVSNRVREALTKGALTLADVDNPGTRNQPDSRILYAQTARALQGEIPRHDSRQKHLGVMSRLPGLVENLSELKSNGRRSREAKLSAVQFNSALRELIDLNPKITPNEIQTIVKSTAVRYKYGPETARAVSEQTGVSLRGMQHELATESVLWRLPEGYEVLETTDEDDINGTDFRVQAPNGTTVSIDIKASEQSAANANLKQDEYYRKTGKRRPSGDIIIYSGFRDADFSPDTPWRPSEESIQEVLPYIQEWIDAAAGYENPAPLYEHV